ncbi:2-(3-amino-3-carboxypropyl)histidine synthase subunit 2 isoform X2 [Cloeon dipterum]|uniref:2-(3-amino-3-carboxypropyl)histidine synthase subunit 2 isoform X2 n=1 Tax=Cloeon dipterum TaxID=197152 RepID=UPI00321F8180
MTSAFSSNDQSAIERMVDETPKEVTPMDQVMGVYDLHRCVRWIVELGLRRICLQFPNHLLPDSVQVCQILKRETKQEIYILGDTNYGSCCIDFIAAEHVPSDGIIHFDDSCLSNAANPKIPVLFVFPKTRLCDNGAKLKSNLEHAIDTLGKSVLIFNCHCLHELDDMKDLKEKTVVSQLLTGERESFSQVLCEGTCSQDCSNKSRHKFESFGRGFCLPDETNLADVTLIYVGTEDSFLQNLVASWSHKFKSIYCLNPEGERFDPLFNYSRFLRQQLRLSLEVKEARSAALVVANPADPSIQKAIRHARELLKSRPSPPKVYTLAVGKPNPAKLANFMEIDVFIVLACPNNPLISPGSRHAESKEFYKPIVSLTEVELALNKARSNASTDYKDLLEGGFDYVPFEGHDYSEADTSLLTGKIIDLSIDSKIEIPNALVSNEDNLRVANLSVGSLLASRTWQGLDPELGQTSPSTLTEGRSGIAYAYQAEPNK